MHPDFDVIVVGGGFYGCTVALHLVSRSFRVLLLEAAPCIMSRASYSNQARVHAGYHYPRSLLTGRRSRVNFPRFVSDYSDCIVADFQKYYAVARHGSNVTARQFVEFCRRIDAPVEPAPPDVRGWFNADMVEDVFQVEEVAFDAQALAERLSGELKRTQVDLRLESEVQRIERFDGERSIRVMTDMSSWTASWVLNCTYSCLNRIPVRSGLGQLPLKHELTEIALVEVPEPLRSAGVTLMCGPFFSTMPFPPRALHSLSHVRYTPHFAWHDGIGENYRDPYALLEGSHPASRFPHMIKDATRYLPLLGDAVHRDSLWEIKTVLPRSEVDDSRPILLKAHPGLARLIHVMGAKIDNVYDVLKGVEGMMTQEATFR